MTHLDLGTINKQMKILILFGHPAFQNSQVNKGLIQGIDELDNVTFHDLYEAYPEMDIDIDAEQELLDAHDCIIFHHPMFWYSSPAIFKEWQDLVLEHGWAYGSQGNHLKGKYFFNVVTTGASRQAFMAGAVQNHKVTEFLVPFAQMARLCKMVPIPPFVIHGSHIAENVYIENSRKAYHQLLQMIVSDQLDLNGLAEYEYINDILIEN